AVLAYKIARESDQPEVPDEVLQLMEVDTSVPLASPIWYQVAMLLQVCYGANLHMGTYLNAAREAYSEHEGAHEDLLYHLANALMLEGTFSEDVARDLALDVQQSDDVDLLKAAIKWGLLFGHGGMTHACVMALLDGAMHEPCDHDRWNFSYL